MHITITEEEIAPENYPLICMDCANHLIMDQRLLIKRDTYQEMIRVKREYEELKKDVRHYFRSRCTKFKHRKLPSKIEALLNE